MKTINGLKMTFVAMFMSLLYTAVSVFAATGDPADVLGSVADFLNPAENVAVLIVLLMGATFVIILDVVLNYRNWKAAFGFGALIGVAASMSPTMMKWFAALTGIGGMIVVGLFMLVAIAGMSYKQKRFNAAANIVNAEGEAFKKDIKEAGNTRVDIYKRLQDVQSKKAHINNLIQQASAKFATAATDDQRTKISKAITEYKKTQKVYDADIQVMKGQLDGIDLKEQQVSREFAKESMEK
ncbi:MAG: hypothetical protein KAR51_01170 [Candidatus Aenigmarchaeota archaeon]|nr:hypothetical protein [Candidatus Aenigmarchaeota archaeon]